MIKLLRCNIGVADKSFWLKHSKEYEVLKEIQISDKRAVVLRLSGEDFGKNYKCNENEDKDTFESSKPMFCCSTSGTTGQSKMVQVPFKCLMPNIFSLT